jgi:hypothetical protein
MRRSLSFHVSDAWRWSLSIWLVVRITLSAIGLFLYLTNAIPDNSAYGDLYFGVTPVRDGGPGALLGVWQRWDTIHWQRVAEQGYSDNGASAFFPLYPALGRLFGLVMPGNHLLALLVISNVALIVSMALLYELSTEDYSAAHARLSVIALAIFPTAFFLFAPYAESLLLMLTLIAYWSARRSRWWLATLAGILAGVTHPLGLSLTVLLATEAWLHRKGSDRRDKIKFILVALSPCIGTGLFFVWRSLSGFLPYVASDQTGWSLQWPWQALGAIPGLFQSGLFFTSGWPNVFILALVMISTLWELKHMRISAALFQVTALLIILSTTSHSTEALGSLGRHCLIIFPMFITVAEWCQRSSRRAVILATFALSDLYLVAQFVQWKWVA